MASNATSRSAARKKYARANDDRKPESGKPGAVVSNAPKAERDVATLQALLKESFGDQTDDVVTGDVVVADREIRHDAMHDEGRPKAGSGRATPPWLSRVLKSLTAFALVGVVGWMPAQRLFQVSSVEAVINARIVTVRAPIAGVVGSKAADLVVGGSLEKGTPLVAISNPRADRQRLGEALQQLRRIEDDRSVIAARLATLKDLRSDLEGQLASFRASRLRQIDARIAEADAHIAAARATQARERAQASRLTSLKGAGLASMAAYEEAANAAAVADANVQVAEASRASLIVEREALENGNFLGDSYNDQPRSAQRIDEVDETIASLEAEAKTLDARLAAARSAVERERSDYALEREARLEAPVSGKVWQILTSPGEQVSTGQDLMTLVDCSQTVVTAAVSEAVYNSLSIGMPASFTFREGGAPLKGSVLQLSGVAAASSNFAIIPTALTKESYRVTVAVDDPGRKNACAIGRTGRVIFAPPSG